MDEMIQRILANILPVIKNTSLSESFFEAVMKRLVSFGYTLKEDDGWMISFAVQKVENHIKSSCNTASVPDGLFHVAVDMACGEFLSTLHHSGQLTIENLDLEGVVTSIKEGDIQVSFGGGSSDVEKLGAFLDYLLHHGERDLVCYRKLSW